MMLSHDINASATHVDSEDPHATTRSPFRRGLVTEGGWILNPAKCALGLGLDPYRFGIARFRLRLPDLVRHREK